MRSKITVLVTGSSGFIGKHLARKLSKKYRLILPTRQSGFDVTDKKKVLKLPKADVLVHLAAIVNVPESWNKPEKFFRVNTLGTLNMLRYCDRNKARMTFASSYMYGIPKYLPIDELHPTSAENPYAVSKLAAEELCYLYGKKGGFETTILRIFNPYGPEQSEKMVISQMFNELIKKKKITIQNGKPRRDFIYIDDVVAAFSKVISNPFKGFRIYNLGFGKSYSIEEVASKIIKISGVDSRLVNRKEKRPNEIANTVADIRKIRKELGWKPKVNIDNGLAKTYEWFKNRNINT